MTKKSGHSTEDWVYANVSLIGSTTKTPIKIVDDGDWYGKESTNVTKTLGSLTKSVTGLTSGGADEKNIYIEHLVSGTYEIGYNMSTQELKVTWPDVNQIQITNSTAGVATGYYDWTSTSGTTSSKAFTTTAAGRISAKIIFHSDFYACNTTSDMSITNHENWRVYDTNNGANICNVWAPVAGTYTFKFNSNYSGNTVLSVDFPDMYTITYGAGTINGSNSAISVSPSFTSGAYVLKSTAVTFSKGTTKAGYKWKGWYSNANGSGTLYSSTNGNWTSAANSRTANISVYACYDYATYTATLSTTGIEGYGSGAPANQTVTYNSAMPAITPPTAANGYAFMGYWDAANGTGTQYYTSTGASARKWNKTSSATLYAYFKKAEITAITLSEDVHEPVAAGGEDVFVTAEPTIAPNPVGTVTVCWELQYSSNGNPVGVEIVSAEEVGHPNKVKFAINGLATGSYKLHAILRLGSGCSGTELGTFDKTFRIASDYTVTVKYMCDGEEIYSSTKEVASPLTAATITAPTSNINYTFVEWLLGDGITLTSGTATSTTISFKASYDATIRAIYRPRGLIYFKKPADWTGAKVYYYNLGSADKWKESDGDWKKRGLYTKDISYGAQEMTRIGSTDIYYYDYEATATTADDPGLYIAFADKAQDGYEPMHDCKASWPIQYTRSFNAGTPLFVPSNYKNSNVYNEVSYYNRGYWTKYTEGTGYTLKIYNQKGGGRTELKSIPFTAEGHTLPYKVTVELEGGQTYGFKFVRDNNIWYREETDKTITYTTRATGGKFIWDNSDANACGITTTATGYYTFTLSIDNSDDGKLQITVDYPVTSGDYRLIYKDDVHNKWHPSDNIAKRYNAKDTVSFFVRKDKHPVLKIQKATVASGGAVTWSDYSATNLLATIPDVISSQTDTMVFNFNLVMNGSGAISLENVTTYTGNFYIRTNAVQNKWDNYKAADHLMTYSAFSESKENSFGVKFSHYHCQWCPRGTNIKFTIANDYSPCISDTLTTDATFNNTDASGTLKTEAGVSDATADKYSANIRFMWNRHSNEIGRAYVASATNITKRFLVLVSGDNKLKKQDGTDIAATANLEANAVLLQDDQNWIYETYIKAVPTARVKLYACYTTTDPTSATTQYFRGKNGAFSNENTIQILGGSGSTAYLMRVIYDFKTNRLVTAWVPDGTNISSDLGIEADVMVIRDHQNPAEAITFSGSSGKLSSVKTVYGVMRFNRWTLNNRYRSKGSETVTDYDKDHSNTTAAISEHHAPLPADRQKSSFERNNYFISFPFDVRLSEVFGFGTYGTHWIISEYKGKRRAERGYFIDNCINEDCTNWDYVIPDLGYDINSYVLEKNKGYLLSLDLDLMQYDDTTHFWLNQIQQVELFFPSSVPMETITSTNVTMPALGSEYECKINYDTPKGSNPEGDRRVKDSYWRCIGVPSYASYGTVLKNESNNDIQWQANYSWEANPNTMPFLYEWNTTDNTLTPQSTKTFTFKPMHAYLVQCKNEIHWTAVNATPASIVARQRQEPQNDYTWTLLLENGDDKSETFIRLTDDEQVTDTFDFGQDMYKEFRDGFLLDENGDPIWDNNIYNYKQGTLHSDLYSLIGTERVAANSLPLNSETTTIVPLGVRAKTAGEYSISLPDGSDGVGVTLVDSETGTRTNLSAGLFYTLDLPAGQTENRLYLEISPVKHTATGIGETDSEPVRNAIRKVLINGILYIVRDGQLYTVTGARVE